MRFYTPLSQYKEWYLTIVYEEVGRPQVVRVGSGHRMFGRGMEYKGQRSVVQIRVVEENASIEIFPGSIILSIVCSEQPGIDECHLASLTNRDRAELVWPSEILVVDPSDLQQIAGAQSFIAKQTDGRKRLVG